MEQIFLRVKAPHSGKHGYPRSCSCFFSLSSVRWEDCVYFYASKKGIDTFLRRMRSSCPVGELISFAIVRCTYRRRSQGKLGPDLSILTYDVIGVGEMCPGVFQSWKVEESQM